MDNPTEYYLEALISDAFKGKGFQKITELFEDKIVCSSQRYSKVLLNQMDRLINKELDRNEFKHVSLLMKCIQYFCKNDCQEGSTLIQQGLVAKMVLWFERTIDFLNISGKKDPSISILVEEFYDTALVICKSNCEDGKKQLLDSFLFRLALVVTEKWPPCHLRIEALRTLNCVLDGTSREEKKRLQASEEMCVLTQDLARTILEAGDYDIQVAISEALCRLMVKKWRDNLALRWFGDSFLADAFKEIKDKYFETDCRTFLNSLNKRLQDKSGVFTFPCITAFADLDELAKPQDEKLEQFWIDFNVGSQCVSFYINNMEGSLWDSVRLTSDALTKYTLQEIDGQQVLNIYLKNPLKINNKDVTKVKIYFKPEHDIKSAVRRVFNEQGEVVCSPPAKEKQDVNPANENTSKLFKGVRTKSTTFEQWKTDQENAERTESLSDILFSQTSGHSSTTKASSGAVTVENILTDSHETFIESVPLQAVIPFAEEQAPTSEALEDSRNLILDDSADVLEVPTKDSEPHSRPMKEDILDEQTTKKKAEDCYELRCSSDSLFCDEVSGAKERVLVQKGSANRTQVSQGTPDMKQVTSNCKSHLFSETNGGSSNRQSEKSWVLNFKNKSLTKSADYSRKKKRSRGKLKVLPLSSESSDDEKKPKKRTSMDRFTFLKKRPRADRGKAKSLSSELKLPGVSGLLTPGDSHLQTFHLSDLGEDDRMDPLAETSSPHSPNRMEIPAKPYLRSPYSACVTEEAKEPAGGSENLKRKRLNRETKEGSEEFVLKPRKLFSSARDSADLDDDVFASETPEKELGEASVITAFEIFTKDLKNKFMSRYKQMEARAQNSLKTSHHQVSTLLQQIHKCRLHKLNHFHKIVVRELSCLESEAQALKGLEKDTLEFWEHQSVKMNMFCENQKQRIKTIDSAFEETVSKLTSALQKTGKDEQLVTKIEDMSIKMK
ncbi:synaptonemal complex protein 2-like [Spea bombifrons]|uniref:synaptonemal complex protein 2-like n=1 Tax=Spea bombifrons TaxID=233779 RepID=UPI00234B30DF|nr:synaptonemal complex protein 2-like [Spea bombifrons]